MPPCLPLSRVETASFVENFMTTDLSRYIVNPGPKAPVSGLKAAVTTDSAIVTETMVNVLGSSMA